MRRSPMLTNGWCCFQGGLSRFSERGKRREWSHIRRVSQMLELLTQVQTVAKVRGGPRDMRTDCVA